MLVLRRNTRFWHSLFNSNPSGWGRGARKRLRQLFEDADSYMQILNDRFTAPSGPRKTQPASADAAEPMAETGVPTTTGGARDSPHPDADQG